MDPKSTPASKIVINAGSNLRHYCAVTHATVDGGKTTVHDLVTIRPGANLLTAEVFASVERDLRFDESRESLQIVGSFAELRESDAVRVTRGTIDATTLAMIAADKREPVRIAAAEQIKAAAKAEA
jgi:hypothetical protein